MIIDKAPGGDWRWRCRSAGTGVLEVILRSWSMRHWAAGMKRARRKQWLTHFGNSARIQAVRFQIMYGR